MEPAIGHMSKGTQTLRCLRDVCISTRDGAVCIIVIYIEEDGVDLGGLSYRSFFHVGADDVRILIRDSTGEKV